MALVLDVEVSELAGEVAKSFCKLMAACSVPNDEITPFYESIIPFIPKAMPRLVEALLGKLNVVMNSPSQSGESKQACCCHLVSSIVGFHASY